MTPQRLAAILGTVVCLAYYFRNDVFPNAPAAPIACWVVDVQLPCARAKELDATWACDVGEETIVPLWLRAPTNPDRLPIDELPPQAAGIFERVQQVACANVPNTGKAMGIRTAAAAWPACVVGEYTKVDPIYGTTTNGVGKCCHVGCSCRTAKCAHAPPVEISGREIYPRLLCRVRPETAGCL